jgi:hypothetical protein
MLFKQANADKSQPTIVFVALDIVKDNGPWNSSTYKLLSAKEKLALLEKSITQTCETLKQKESKDEFSKDSMWIISWREHGVSEADSNYATIETKALLRAMIDKLTAKYEKLTIIAGTIKTKRHIDEKKQDSILKNIQKRYDNLDHVLTLENKAGHAEFKSHKERFTTVLQQMGGNGFSVTRNTVTVLPGNYKRSKTAAWDEIDKTDKSTEIFYPGRTENMTTNLTLRNNKAITVGIEICYEHFLGILKSDPSKPVFLHLILSDCTPLNMANLKGLYNIQIDSKHGVTFAASGNKNNPKLILYKMDMNMALKNNITQMEGPIIPQNYFNHVISSGIEIPDIDRFVKDEIIASGIQSINELLPDLVFYGNEAYLLCLFKNGAHANTIENNKTLLEMALQHKNYPPNKVNVVKILLDHKADPAIKNDKGETALHIAAEKQQLDIIKLFLSSLPIEKKKTFINLTTNSGQTAAHIAAEKGHDIAILQLLHEHGADLTIADEQQQTPLDYLAKNMNIKAEDKSKFISSLDAKTSMSPKRI